MKFILPNNLVFLGLSVDNISSFTLTLKRIYAYLYSEPSSSGVSTVPNSHTGLPSLILTAPPS